MAGKHRLHRPRRTSAKSHGQDRVGTKLALTMLILALLGAVVGVGTWSAFSDTTENEDNDFATGTVIITDDDGGSAMLVLADAKPGDSDTSCIKVTYTGTLSATVRLYGTTTGSGLDPYLDLTVTRGTKASAFDSCADFVADSTDYNGDGPGVIFDGTLQGYPDGYATGIVDPTSGSPETWTTSETHSYMFVITVQDDPNAQGLSANQTFTWEAQNT
jgi:predicted ribosomally synthesized peptide with SipW-like signal peptide